MVTVKEAQTDPAPAAREVWDRPSLQGLRESALAAGFAVVGVAPVHDPEHAAEQGDAERLAAWLDLGRAGEMNYLKRRDEAGRLLRQAVQVPMPWARSVVLCGFNYNAEQPKSTDPAPAGAGWIGRYAWSGSPVPDAAETGPELRPADYHDDLLHRLRQIEAHLQEATRCASRCYVDTGPLVERSLAARAGVGWIGKNTCVLNQELGSWLLLGAVVTSLRVAPEAAASAGLAAPAADRCGSCTRCLDACPTQALVAPRQMDASRCIAYLTIEKKGTVPEELRAGMGRQVFGCDICQDVCPWNRRSPVSTDPEFVARPELVNPSLAWLASLDGPAFRRVFRGSPIERTGRKRMQRNVAIAMGNSGELGFAEHLQTWAQGEDIVLRETAAWALDRLGAAPACSATIAATSEGNTPARSARHVPDPVSP